MEGLALSQNATITLKFALYINQQQTWLSQRHFSKYRTISTHYHGTSKTPPVQFLIGEVVDHQTHGARLCCASCILNLLLSVPAPLVIRTIVKAAGKREEEPVHIQASHLIGQTLIEKITTDQEGKRAQWGLHPGDGLTPCLYTDESAFGPCQPGVILRYFKTT